MFSPLRAGLARRLSVLATVLILAACASEDTDVAEVRTVSGFAGIAAADEPRAALVGRQVLGQNGTAADAAVAMGLTMSVTLPSRVGLGGGGACVVHDRSERRAEALLFLPEPARRGGMIPGMARGLAALHARYGARDWRTLVAPAEQLARFGHLVSRSLHRDLVAGAGRLGPEARSHLLREDGAIPDIGARVTHPALSAALSGLRQQGAGYLYIGPFARRLADDATDAGEPVDITELLNYRARLKPTLEVPYGNHKLHLPPPPVLGGLSAGQLWGMLQTRGSNGAANGRDAHLFVEAWKRALSERRVWLETPATGHPAPQSLVAEDYLAERLVTFDADAATPATRLTPPPSPLGQNAPTAGFAVADRFGDMVACGFTMNGLFGTGKEAGGTGILLPGRAPKAESGTALAPAILSNQYTGTAYLAASGTDGTAGQTSLIELVRQFDTAGVAQSSGQEVDLQALLAQPRIHHPGQPDQVQLEPDVPASVADTLHTLGHTVVRASGLGRVQAVYCPRGARDGPQACQAATDPRGAGLAVRAQ